MCIAILNTKGILSKNELRNCFNSNRDGMGFAYPKNGVINTFRELKNFDKFVSAYIAARKANPDVNFLVHFRITTHGNTNLTNCHPFTVNKKLAFIHNGMIETEYHKEFSDTYMFNELILKALPKGFHLDPAHLTLLERYIDYSKIVFLDADNNYSILNESAGHWQGANWYSNYSYCTPAAKYTDSKISVKEKKVNDWHSFDEWESIGCEACGSHHDNKYVREEDMILCKSCRKLVYPALKY